LKLISLLGIYPEKFVKQIRVKSQSKPRSNPLMVMFKITEVMNCSVGDMKDFIPDDRNVSVEESVKQKEPQESYAFW